MSEDPQIKIQKYKPSWKSKNQDETRYYKNQKY